MADQKQLRAHDDDVREFYKGRRLTLANVAFVCLPVCLSVCLSVCLACGCCCSFDISTVINGKCSASPQLASAAVFQLSAFNAHVEKIHMLSVCGVRSVCVCVSVCAVWYVASVVCVSVCVCVAPLIDIQRMPPYDKMPAHLQRQQRFTYATSLSLSLSPSFSLSLSVNNWREVVAAYCCL